MSPRTRADSIAVYLSGAASDGGVQTDPALSLGGYRSSRRADSLAILIDGPIPSIRIDHASGGNGEGFGYLVANTDDSLVWTSPASTDGVDGEPVEIANGQQRVIESTDPNAYLLVTRLTADPMAGRARVSLVRSFNDLFGQSDAEIGSSPAATYRLAVFRAGLARISSLKIWIGDHDPTVRIARENPSGGTFQAIANESTSPTGVGWVSPTSAGHADVISLSLNANQTVGIWIERTTPAAAAARQQLGLAWSFTAIG